MKAQNKSKINVETTIDAPVEKVWDFWTKPEHITKWNSASEDWHTPTAENELRVGGKFVSRMEAKDGSAGFDFSGVYDEISEHEHIAYTMDDGRKVEIFFSEEGNKTRVREIFDPEETNSREMQRSGWQAILDNFKTYTETTPDINWQKLHFSIEINAPKEEVWNIMLEDETYHQWTGAFTEGSHYKGSWEQGSKILFLDPENNGMVSEIAENRPYEFISIKHLGIVKNGVEDTESEEVQNWAPAFENYTFTEINGKTTVKVDMDVEEGYKAMFEKMWPNALNLLKDLSEK